jgi:ATP-dependent protease ClpP protease subunit
MKRKQLEQILSHDIWFRMDECIEKGLVDEEYKG